MIDYAYIFLKLSAVKQHKILKELNLIDNDLINSVIIKKAFKKARQENKVTALKKLIESEI